MLLPRQEEKLRAKVSIPLIARLENEVKHPFSDIVGRINFISRLSSPTPFGSIIINHRRGGIIIYSKETPIYPSERTGARNTD